MWVIRKKIQGIIPISYWKICIDICIFIVNTKIIIKLSNTLSFLIGSGLVFLTDSFLSIFCWAARTNPYSVQMCIRTKSVFECVCVPTSTNWRALRTSSSSSSPSSSIRGICRRISVCMRTLIGHKMDNPHWITPTTLTRVFACMVHKCQIE